MNARPASAIPDRLAADIVGWSLPAGGPSQAMRFAPLTLPRQSEEVADRIGSAIREGVLHVGDRLPSERALAEQFGTSRPTLRDAVRKLADAGIVTVRPGVAGGIFVADELVPVRPIELRHGEMEEILEARRLIMPRICETAAQYVTDDDLDAMRAAIAFGRAVLEPPRRAMAQRSKLQLNISCIRFDMAVAQATGNRLLVQTMRSLLDWLEPLRLLSLADLASARMSMTVQEDTLAAIGSGDVAEIHRALDRRMAFLERTWEAHTGRTIRTRRQRPAR